MWSSNLNSSATLGGGFLNESRKGGQDNFKARRIQAHVPLMIEHLNKFPSIESTQFWHIPAQVFTIVGIVRSVEETATKISYIVEDQTGTITALKWLEADRKASDQTMQVNTYIRIIGLLREQNDKRHILILQVGALKNLNELTSHILEVTFATLRAESMARKTKESGSQVATPNINETPAEDSPYYGMTVDQTLVYKIIHAQNETDSGIERPEIKAKVPKKILPEVDNILDFLVSEGHIYTTSTDDHFKTT